MVIGGLIFASFTIQKTGVIKQSVSLSGATFIKEARGAEIDSAALKVQDAPFLASGNTGADNVTSGQNLQVFYGNGAVRDPGTR